MPNPSQCPICKCLYEYIVKKPKLLLCGHTSCLSCASSFSKVFRQCYACNTQVQEEIPLPTNHCVIIASSIPTVRAERTPHLNTPNEKLLKLIETQQTRLYKKLEKSIQMKGSLSENENIYDRLDHMRTKPIPFEFGGRIQGMNARLDGFVLINYSYRKPRINSDFIFSTYDRKEGFYRHIMVELYRKNDIFTFKTEWYQKNMHWGKLSYREKQLCIHTFTTDRPPRSSLTVAFKDLEKCMSLDNFRTFIDIAADHIVCQLLSSSNKAWTFIKLCTGEEEKSFKESTVKIQVFNRGGDRYTDIIIKGKERYTSSQENYLFLQELPRIVEESLKGKLHIAISGDVCRIRKFTSLNNTSESCDVFPIASAEAFGNIFSQELTIEKESTDNYLEMKATVKDCGILVLPLNKEHTYDIPGSSV